MLPPRVRYRNEGSTVLGDGEQKYKFWFKDNSEGTNGVGILVKHELAENIIEVSRYSDRLMSIKAVLGDSAWHVFSLYAPQIGRPAVEKQEFWDRAEEEFGRVPQWRTVNFLVGCATCNPNIYDIYT